VIARVEERHAGSLNEVHTVDAFGLRVEADWPLAGATPAPSVTSGRYVATVRRVEPALLASVWDLPAERLLEREFRGEIAMTFERAEDYRIWAKGFGRYLVSADGCEVRCEQGGIPDHVQERFLFAQVVPLAAVLQGFELLHASAICLKGVAVAFAGPSGAGKTTLMSRLLARGAGLLTDDALSLEHVSGKLVAHPGPPYVAIAERGDGGPADLVEQLGQVVGKSDKLNAVVPTVQGAFPLRAVYHIEPGSALELLPLDTDVVQRLLGSVSVPYVLTSDRLQRLLQTAHVLAETVPQVRLRFPRIVDITDVVEAVEAHARTWTT
jgi:hypothetical protein